MKWAELIAKLDGVRTVIRANKDPKADVRKDDPILDQLIAALDIALGGTPTIDPAQLELPADTVPPEPVTAEPIAIVQRGEGEGRMLIMPRATPRVSRPPQLEEVLDEKDLAK